MKSSILLSTLLLTALSSSLSASGIQHLAEDWRLASSCKISASAEAISVPGFDAKNWLRTSVPSTVVAAQVAAHELPDPYFGKNLRMLPGVSYPIGRIFSKLPMPADSPYACSWWYRHSFVPAHAPEHTHFWLHFSGINYRASIWLNGHKVAGPDQVAGAYRTYDFDVTSLLLAGKENVLAVEVSAQTEKDLGINWVDWNPAPPDKNMGLWGAVDLVQSGPVALRSPHVVTHLADETGKNADLTVYAEVQNATAKTIEGTAAGSIAGVAFEQKVTLAPHEKRTLSFSPEKFPQLHLHNAKLWWPRAMGEPRLETLTVAFRSTSGVLDEKSIRTGLREITSEFTPQGGRLFRINGKPILIRGAGWSPDMLLRNDNARLREQIRMVLHMHLNAIRLEGKLENEEFFRMTDEEGILVLAGWCCCDHWERWADWAKGDLPIAEESLRSQMLRLRAHPSLLVWLNGSDTPPPADVERAYLAIEAETHWPNPTISSASVASTTVTGESGVKMTGPYDYVPPVYWYVATNYGGALGFNTETSAGPSIPSLASRRKYLPDAEAWPPTENWSFHYGSGRFATLDTLNKAMNASYGEPHSAAQFERTAQAMEYDSERAMFESYGQNKYASTGVIQWMLNNAWPSMFWHLYDYNLEAGAGYFATRKACEPLHIQYAYDKRNAVVVNSTYKPQHGLHASIQVHSLSWKELYRAETDLELAPDSAQQAFSLPKKLFSGPEQIFFIDLALRDASGKLLSKNFYWIPATQTSFDWAKTDFTHTPASHFENLTALSSLPQARVTAHAEMRRTREGREVRVQLENSTEALAFQLRAALRTPAGDLIAPVFWSDNWIALAPGESTTLTALLPETYKDAAVVVIDGWNLAPTTLKISDTGNSKP